MDRLHRALDGCDAAYFLIHGMGSHVAGFRERERAGAERFAFAAGHAGLRRVVYLGGLDPHLSTSEHLASRLEVGEVLRAGRVPAVELRASMIVGYGSLSWQIVRDLAARLPAMVLPRWLKSRTQPVGIDDVVIALARALDLPLDTSACFDLPGPEELSAREILERTADLLGLRRPQMLEVPFLSPWLSSHWVRFVTRAEWSIAREIVVGLAHDLLASDDRYWSLIEHTRRQAFNDAARQAIAAEREQGSMAWPGRAVERAVMAVHGGRRRATE